jgi:quercetin dioxygenase-like cupin family protein
VLHRTVSLDYGVVIEGEVESQLDDGEVQRVRKGDVVV